MEEPTAFGRVLEGLEATIDLIFDRRRSGDMPASPVSANFRSKQKTDDGGGGGGEGVPPA